MLMVQINKIILMTRLIVKLGFEICLECGKIMLAKCNFLFG